MKKGGALTDLSTRTPSGDGVIQRAVEKPAFGDDLLEHILDSENLRRAWNRVRANKGAAGVDGMSIDEFPDWAKARDWKRVVCELKTDHYRPSPVRRVEIDKPDGSKRPRDCKSKCVNARDSLYPTYRTESWNHTWTKMQSVN